MKDGAHSHGHGGLNARLVLLAVPVTMTLFFLWKHPWLIFCGGAAAVLYAAAKVRAATRRRRKRAACGTATMWEKHRRLSGRAASRRVPGLAREHAAVTIGRSGGQRLTCARTDAKLLLAPPRTWKTALISSWLPGAPGAVVGFSSRGDLHAHTSERRRGRGDVYVLDADGDTGIEVNFRWDPVGGCGNPQTAIRRAADFVAAAPRDPSGRNIFHEERDARFQSYLWHAAAVAGAPAREVYWWAADPLSGQPQKHLRHEDAFPGWALELDALLDSSDVKSITAGALSSLGWMRDPVLSAVTNPGRDQPRLNPRRFAHEGKDTIYLTGLHREFGSAAPLFAAVAADIFAAARHVAERSPGRHLARPLTMALDEFATGCPVPVHQWAAVAAGYWVELIAGVQSPSQLVTRLGEQGARTVNDCFPVKVIGGGFGNYPDLEALSALCGHEPAAGESRPERVFSPEAIRLIRDWHALVITRNARPVEAVIKPVWKQRGYTPAPGPDLEFELEPPARVAIEGAA